MSDKDSCVVSDLSETKLLRYSDLRSDNNPFKLSKFDVSVNSNITYEYIKKIIEYSDEDIEDRIIDKETIRKLFYEYFFLFDLKSGDVDEIKMKYQDFDLSILKEDYQDIKEDIKEDYEEEEVDLSIFEEEENDTISKLEEVPVVQVKETPKIDSILEYTDCLKLKEKYKSNNLQKLHDLLQKQSLSEIIRKRKDIILFCKNNNLNMEIEDLEDLSSLEINSICEKISESESSDLTAVIIIGTVNLIEFIAVKVFNAEFLNGFTKEYFIDEASKFRTKFKSTVTFLDDKVGNPNKPGIDILIYIGYQLLKRVTYK